MTPGRQLIVNADDFGQSPGVNEGVITAHERGIVTSASLMVRWPAAASAAAYARAHPQLSVGLHVDLGEWAYRNGEWVVLYEVPAPDAAAVADEVAQQLAAFHRLVGRNPTHMDSHQHVHRRDASVRLVLARLARRLTVPLRGYSRVVQHHGGFYGQTAEGSPLPDHITVDALVETLRTLPAGVTELGCHPGLGDDLEGMYRIERVREVEVLCDSRVRAFIRRFGIELQRF